jgi:hypothetical protein
MEFEAPTMEAVEVSVALIIWLPAVIRVAERTLLPDASVESAGSCALGSVLVKCTVPAYLVTVAFEASSAVTVKLREVPEGTLTGAVTEK